MTGFDRVGCVGRDTFVGADQVTRDNMMFDMLASIHEKMDEHCTRIKKLERRKKFDTSVAAGSGIVGGMIAILTQKLW